MLLLYVAFLCLFAHKNVWTLTIKSQKKGAKLAPLFLFLIVQQSFLEFKIPKAQQKEVAKMAKKRFGRGGRPPRHGQGRGGGPGGPPRAQPRGATPPPGPTPPQGPRPPAHAQQPPKRESEWVLRRVASLLRNAAGEAQWVVSLKIVNTKLNDSYGGMIRVNDENEEETPMMREFQISPAGGVVRLPVRPKLRIVKFVVLRVWDDIRHSFIYPDVYAEPLLLQVGLGFEEDYSSFELWAIPSEEKRTVNGKTGGYWRIHLTVFGVRQGRMDLSVPAQVHVHGVSFGNPVSVPQEGCDIFIPFSIKKQEVRFSIQKVWIRGIWLKPKYVSEPATKLPGKSAEDVPRIVVQQEDGLSDIFWKTMKSW